MGKQPMQPVIVGEANPYGADPYFAMYPDPPNSAGGRLCRVVLHMEPDDYLAAFERVNLCPHQWSMKVARANAVDLVSSDKPLILLGSKVCAAFGIPFAPFTECLLTERLQRTGAHRMDVVILPHPSGLSRLWHEKGAYRRARVLVESLAARTAEVAAAQATDTTTPGGKGGDRG